MSEELQEQQRQTAELTRQLTRLSGVVDRLVQDSAKVADIVCSTDPASPGLAMRQDRTERRNQFLFGGNMATLGAVFLMAWKLAQAVDKLGGL